jgi:hypothetical protein
MEVNSVKCNVCGRQKQETNHWLVAITKPGFEGILFLPAEAVETPRNPDFTYEDLCGQACSLKRHSRWLDDLHDTAPTTQESVNA